MFLIYPQCCFPSVHSSQFPHLSLRSTFPPFLFRTEQASQRHSLSTAITRPSTNTHNKAGQGNATHPVGRKGSQDRQKSQRRPHFHCNKLHTHTKPTMLTAKQPCIYAEDLVQTTSVFVSPYVPGVMFSWCSGPRNSLNRCYSALKCWAKGNRQQGQTKLKLKRVKKMAFGLAKHQSAIGSKKQ